MQNLLQYRWRYVFWSCHLRDFSIVSLYNHYQQMKLWWVQVPNVFLKQSLYCCSHRPSREYEKIPKPKNNMKRRIQKIYSRDIIVLNFLEIMKWILLDFQKIGDKFWWEDKEKPANPVDTEPDNQNTNKNLVRNQKPQLKGIHNKNYVFNSLIW